MKNFFLKRRDEAPVTRLDPVTALEERFKSIDTITDPAERLLALQGFYNDCHAACWKKDQMSFLKKLGGSFSLGAAVGAITFPFLGPLAVFSGTTATVVSFMSSLLFTNSTVKRLAHLEKTAETLRDSLIKTGDLRKMVASPFFDAAVIEFPPLKERFQLAAQKTAFLEQKQAPLPHPQKPDNGLRL